MDEFLDFNDVSKEQLFKAFPELTADSWHNAIDITLTRPDDLSNPIVQKADSMVEMIESLDGGYSSLTGLDYDRDEIFKTEYVLIDNEVLKESYNE